MALKGVKGKKKSSAFSNMDDLKVAEERSLEIEKDISVKPEPEKDLNTKPEGKPEENKITRRRNIKGTVNNLSLRLNTEDLMVVKFLSLKSKKSIQALLIEGLNLLIRDELERSPEDHRYLHHIV